MANPEPVFASARPVLFVTSRDLQRPAFPVFARRRETVAASAGLPGRWRTPAPGWRTGRYLGLPAQLEPLQRPQDTPDGVGGLASSSIGPALSKYSPAMSATLARTDGADSWVHRKDFCREVIRSQAPTSSACRNYGRTVRRSCRGFPGPCLVSVWSMSRQGRTRPTACSTDGMLSACFVRRLLAVGPAARRRNEHLGQVGIPAGQLGATRDQGHRPRIPGDQHPPQPHQPGGEGRAGRPHCRRCPGHPKGLSPDPDPRGT